LAPVSLYVIIDRLPRLARDIHAGEGETVAFLAGLEAEHVGGDRSGEKTDLVHFWCSHHCTHRDRQARDKHRENSKGTCFLAGVDGAASFSCMVDG
jgi:hypothetical protein